MRPASSLVLVAALAGPLVAQERPATRATPVPPELAQVLREWETLNDPKVQRREPFKVFDNLYYVGTGWVSAYVVTTSDGLIVIDSLYGVFTGDVAAGVRRLGFDPRKIRYCLVTHGHFDHAGGAKAIQDLSGARVGMTEADWALAESTPRAGPMGFPLPRRDLVVRDGDAIQLGDTTLEAFVTPGHTPGVLSLRFPVRDGAQSHTAFTFGGVGLNFSGVERTEMYLASVRRVMGMAGLAVNVPNHPGSGEVFERAQRLKERKPGDPHPFVAPQDFQSWLKQLEAAAEKKLSEEKAR